MNQTVLTTEDELTIAKRLLQERNKDFVELVKLASKLALTVRARGSWNMLDVASNETMKFIAKFVGESKK